MNTEKTDTSLTTTRDDAPVVTPLVDIYESAKALHFVVDMPGVADDQIDVRLEKGELTFEGRRPPKVNAPGNLGAVYRRAFVVPKGIMPDGIVANYSDGVLSVDVPKTDVAASRQIQVNVG